MATTFFDLSAKDSSGAVLPFSRFKGQVVLVVNVASKCGFTNQYKGLQELYQQYKDQGFTILGAPCNQFGGQEPGTQGEIVEFCTRNYGVDFPILEKLKVNGDDTHPMYVWLKSQKKSLFTQGIKWNFEKFLIDKDGSVYQRYLSTTSPAALASDVEKLLAKPSPDGTAAHTGQEL